MENNAGGSNVVLLKPLTAASFPQNNKSTETKNGIFCRFFWSIETALVNRSE